MGRSRLRIFRFQLVSLAMTLIAIIGASLAIGVLVLIPIVIARVGLSGYAQILVALPSFVVMIVFVIVALGLLTDSARPGPGASSTPRRGARDLHLAARLLGVRPLCRAIRRLQRDLRPAFDPDRADDVVLSDRLCRAVRRRGERGAR